VTGIVDRKGISKAYSKERLQALLNFNKANYDSRIKEMKQTLLRYNLELDV